MLNGHLIKLVQLYRIPVQDIVPTPNEGFTIPKIYVLLQLLSYHEITVGDGKTHHDSEVAQCKQGTGSRMFRIALYMCLTKGEFMKKWKRQRLILQPKYGKPPVGEQTNLSAGQRRETVRAD